MRKLSVFLVVLAASMLSASLAVAVEMQVFYVDTLEQDQLWIPRNVHEIGDNPPFPAGERIRTDWWEVTTLTACTGEPYDNPKIANILVQITRTDVLDELYSVPVSYVADLGTTISNYDGVIGNVGLQDAQQAFRIDALGINKPLIYESKVQNNRLDPGETWQFIIQDFVNGQGIPAAPFASIGIASLSSDNLGSSGSLLVPEPATLALLVLGGIALVRRRRA